MLIVHLLSYEWIQKFDEHKESVRVRRSAPLTFMCAFISNRSMSLLLFNVVAGIAKVLIAFLQLCVWVFFLLNL